MRFIKAWSYKCAAQLSLSLKESHEKKRVYYYGFEVVIGTAVKLVLLLLAALVLGIIGPVLMIIAVFSSLRVLAGGYHMDTYGKCFILSLLMFLLSGIVAQYTYRLWSITNLILFSVITFICALFAMLKWAPSDTENRPIIKPEEIKKFKMLSVVCIAIWGVVISVLIAYSQNLLVIAGCFGLLLEAFMITPAAYKIFNRLSGNMDKMTE